MKLQIFFILGGAGFAKPFVTTVKAFKEKNIIPMTVGEKDGWPGIFYQNILAIRTAGIESCTNALNKQESFNQPGFVQSANKLQELVRAEAFDSRSMQLTRDEAQSDFRRCFKPN